MGGPGEQTGVSVERLNDMHVIPQWYCRTSTATRSLLHVPSSAPSTAALDAVGDGVSSGQAGDWAACLMRLVSSVTWLKVERRSAMRVRIFLSALMTVV